VNSVRLLAFIALSAPAGRADTRWVSIQSPHFELHTDAGAGAGRRLLERLEQVHRVFRGLAPGSTGSPLPVRVFLFRSKADFRPFAAGKTTAGYFQNGSERNYIVLRDSGDDTGRIVCHEYVHLVLYHTGARLPSWLEEGTAEFYSTIEAAPTRLIVGRAIPGHMQALGRGAWLPVDVLASIDKNSPYYSSPGKSSVFYAQSWALVHMLNLSPAYREGTPKFAGLLEDGMPVVEAFRQAYGKSLAAALDDLARYVASGSLPVVELDPPPTEDLRISPPTPLADVEARLAKSELLLETGAGDAAEAEYRRIAREHAGKAEVETSLGTLALSRREHAEARRHLERAIGLGSRDSRTYLEYAMLLRDTGGDSEAVLRNLREAVSLNPRHADAQFLLGTLLATAGRYEEAIQHLELAASVLPRRPHYWHALALSCHRAGRAEQALRAARRALQAAVTPQETEMAIAAIRLAETPPAVSPGKRPDVLVPESWLPKRGDSRLEGMIERVDCLGNAARFHIREGDRITRLYLADPRRLQSTGMQTFEFRCGPMKPAPVVAEFNARPDPKLGTAGDLVTLDFK
jgi:tetratricopeptide (TPR) repeat protein